MRGTMSRAAATASAVFRLLGSPMVRRFMTGEEAARRMATHVGAERLRAEIARLEAERES